MRARNAGSWRWSGQNGIRLRVIAIWTAPSSNLLTRTGAVTVVSGPREVGISARPLFFSLMSPPELWDYENVRLGRWSRQQPQTYADVADPPVGQSRNPVVGSLDEIPRSAPSANRSQRTKNDGRLVKARRLSPSERSQRSNREGALRKCPPAFAAFTEQNPPSADRCRSTHNVPGG